MEEVPVACSQRPVLLRFEALGFDYQAIYEEGGGFRVRAFKKKTYCFFENKA